MAYVDTEKAEAQAKQDAANGVHHFVQPVLYHFDPHKPLVDLTETNTLMHVIPPLCVNCRSLLTEESRDTRCPGVRDGSA